MRFSAISLVSIALPAILLSTSTDALPPSHPVTLQARDALSAWDLNKTPYLGKGAVNTRAPCPMLNTMANHGLLPFNGRDITRVRFYKALASIGLEEDVITVLVTGAFKQVGRQGSSGEVVDLEGLQAHNKIEHDVSFSRQDYDVTGDDATLNTTLFRQLELFLTNDGNLDAQGVSDARKLRLLQATRDNPKLDFSFGRVLTANGESSILLDVMGRNGRISRESLESFFLHERFPESWKPPSPSINVLQVGKRAAELDILLKQSKVTLDWEKKTLPEISQ